MHNLPYQLRKSIGPLSLLLILLAAGCAAPQKEFEPPIFPAEPETPRYIYDRTLMSSADVEGLSSADKFKFFATGQSKKVKGLAKPYDVAVHQGRVYVSDTIHRGVVMFDIPGKRFKIFGTEGKGALFKPIGIDVAENGEVFVLDNGAHRVAVYSADGNYLRAFAGKADLDRPAGLAVSGSRVYVVDTGGVSSQNHRVQVYDANSGKRLATIGKRGVEEGEFNLPLMIDADAKGNTYIMDSGNFRVQRFDENDKFHSTFGEVGIRFGQFARPKGLAVDGEGNIYVTDASFSNFQIFNNSGELLMFIGGRGEVNEPAKFGLLAGIDVDEDGRIYVVDQFYGKVEIFRPYAMKKEEGFAGIKPEK
ncbi:MAG: hypothetical protein OEZ16_01315 [Chromatiales bacterium]|nr:hypothetical protein [Chromatiales bacterium]